MRIGSSGELEIVDPGLDTLALLESVDPRFGIAQAALPAGVNSPVFLRSRAAACGIELARLGSMCVDDLWTLHDGLIRRNADRAPRAGEASLLDLKAALAQAELRRCELCARQCGVDRSAGPAGACGLGPDAFVAEHFVHIAEEPPINPSLVLNLRGCGLRCRYCQQHAIVEPCGTDSERLTGKLWERLSTAGARTLSFAGGNPDESLPAILRFLQAAPAEWDLPIVWNCHAYMAPRVSKLLEGVVDVLLPDLKYFDDRCARRWSGVGDYRDAATTSLTHFLTNGTPVIVRILLLPGHFECCHAPALEFLASLGKAPELFVSIRGQYSPDWKIGVEDGLLARRCTRNELARTATLAAKLGLQAV
jgi:putative pyruvate formate lyase activating enzyme